MTFEAKENGRIKYIGNEIFDPIEDIRKNSLSKNIENRVKHLKEDGFWSDLAKINNIIYRSTVDFFQEIGAKYTLLPLTTRMISSPGAAFGSEKIDYTQDTVPVKLDWFDHEKNMFLAESSQIYLELALVQGDIDQVFSIYNSFRKEERDHTHLPEFHHIEYEGEVKQERNEEIIEGLIKEILGNVLAEGRESLETFLTHEKITKLEKLKKDPVKKIEFEKALELLKEDTGKDKYDEFTLEYFDDWEEVRLTELLSENGVKPIVCLREFPLLEVAFYHAPKDLDEENKRGINADFIWPGYKETVGSGQRISDIEVLRKKAEIFNLPQEDYQIYMRTRELEEYETTSGFGVGWERLLQGILDMPTITSCTHFPRCHKTLKP